MGRTMQERLEFIQKDNLKLEKNLLYSEKDLEAGAIKLKGVIRQKLL